MAGRFAPSPTGELHQGSLVAAMASYLDARFAGEPWLIRIEDIDPPRTVPGADQAIINTLAQLGMHSDGPVVYQSQRSALYQQAFARLQALDQIFGCQCSRRELEDLGASRYPGTCRDRGLNTSASPAPLAWRVRLPKAPVEWTDRWLGSQSDDLSITCGEFVVRRKDGLWAYQLAVVMDDAAQGVSSVVRGADLLDSTGRQIHLQQLLGLPRPRYMHVPLVLAADGEKLSKQNGASPIAASWAGKADPWPAQLQVLNLALGSLQLQPVSRATDIHAFWSAATAQWAARWSGALRPAT
jgi:glutamyl-Q tRNA(Asp) synthetase